MNTQKRRYDSQLLQAKIDYMAALHAPCVLAIVGNEVYAYNSRSAAFMAHGFKALYQFGKKGIKYNDMSILFYARFERHIARHGECCHFNQNLCKCWHTGTKGEYWRATPLADGTIELAEVKR